jgi:hypothetical protein
MGWLLVAGVLLCLLGLVMDGAASRSAALEATDAQWMVPPAGAAVTVAASGLATALPACAMLPAPGLCVDAESDDPADPDMLSTLRSPLPALHFPPGADAHQPLALAALQPLLRPPRGQG